MHSFEQPTTYSYFLLPFSASRGRNCPSLLNLLLIYPIPFSSKGGCVVASSSSSCEGDFSIPPPPPPFKRISFLLPPDLIENSDSPPPPLAAERTSYRGDRGGRRGKKTLSLSRPFGLLSKLRWGEGSRGNRRRRKKRRRRPPEQKTTFFIAEALLPLLLFCAGPTSPG